MRIWLISSLVLTLYLLVSCNRKASELLTNNCLSDSLKLTQYSVLYLWDIQNDSVMVKVNNQLVYLDHVKSIPKNYGKPILSFYEDKDIWYVENCKERWEVSNLFVLQSTIGNASREDVINVDSVKTILLYHSKNSNEIAIEKLDRLISFE